MIRRQIMKYRGTTVVWLVAIMFVVGLATTTSAATISLVPSENAPERGDTFTLDIVIDDATGVAGCALTLVYPEALLDLANGSMPVTTSFFDLFYDNREGADPAQAYPWEKNTQTAGKILLSGAYIDTVTGGGNYTGSQILFTVHFAVKSDAPLGVFDFTLEQTQLLNTDAGWGDGTNPESVPVLIGAVDNTHEDWLDLTKAFPVMSSTFDSPLTVTPGIQPCTDTDQDGLCDIVETNTGIYVGPQDAGTDPNNPDTDGDDMFDGWEVTYGLDPLDDNDASVDLDGDGFTNLQEYQRGTDPGDPDSHPPRAMPWLPLLLDD
jgi:hypothetical protein